jgi:hypothetical protein
VGKAGTTPEGLDIVVSRGPYPGNVGPVVTISANTTNASVGAAVTFQAEAADPNGDTLAYFWDFGDQTAGSNQPVVLHSWPANGEFVVRCTVSDLRGGQASASVVVRVGSVTTFLAQGRIRRHGEPEEGELVKATSLFSYTDSDGTYRISRLRNLRYTLGAALEGWNFADAGADNPVTLSGSTTGIDFEALPDALNSVTLIQLSSVWRYRDDGVFPGSGWASPTYDDNGWKSGRAKLGYGLGNETTMISYGSDTTNRYLTTWFRQSFVLGNPSAVQHLVCRLRRDDGAVAYLNGQEVFRANMPAGEVLPSTRALVDVASTEEPVYFTRWASPASLVPGTNVIAVEIHLASPASLDLGFDLEVWGEADDLAALRPSLTVQAGATNISILWPSAYNGWSLYGATELGPIIPWALSGNPAASNGWSSVLFPSPQAQEFFRLRKPGFCGTWGD